MSDQPATVPDWRTRDAATALRQWADELYRMTKTGNRLSRPKVDDCAGCLHGIANLIDPDRTRQATP